MEQTLSYVKCTFVTEDNVVFEFSIYDIYGKRKYYQGNLILKSNLEDFHIESMPVDSYNYTSGIKEKIDKIINEEVLEKCKKIAKFIFNQK